MATAKSVKNKLVKRRAKKVRKSRKGKKSKKR